MGIISSNSGVIHTVAGRWQKVTRKGLESTAGHPACSQFTGQNEFCIQYDLFKATSPFPNRASSKQKLSLFEILWSPSPSACEEEPPKWRFLYKTVIQLWPVLTKPFPPPPSHPQLLFLLQEILGLCKWHCLESTWQNRKSSTHSELRQKPAVHSFNEGVLSTCCVPGWVPREAYHLLCISSWFPTARSWKMS